MLYKTQHQCWESVFLGLLDPDTDPLVRATYPDPVIIKQN
jgi:hypothetical protein